MSEGAKRSLRERRAPKTFDSDVSQSLDRTKTSTPMDMVAIPTLRYVFPH
jgi:hypothetical protein